MNMNSHDMLKSQLKARNYSGGDGSCEEEAIIIKIGNTPEGIAAAYEYLQVIYGVQDVEWEVVRQQLYHNGDRHYDIIEIKLEKDGSIQKDGQIYIYR